MTRKGRLQITLFTITEANATAAEIRPELEELMRAQRELNLVQARIDVLDLASSGATADNPDARELRSLQTRRMVLAARIRRGIALVHRRGALVKDLERGLVDFYALSGDQLVFLCWQVSETEVSHWHSLAGGFAARQPVEREVE
jgi:hypothetical protein